MTTPRVLPSIDNLRQRPAVQELETLYGATAVLGALRAASTALRRELTSSAPPPIKTSSQATTLIEQRASLQLAVGFAPSLVPVINATGVIVHTNLGRAPLAESATRQVAQLASGYMNLEYDLATGRRGSRNVHADAVLSRVTGAAAAVVVNNNAAAVLLVLAALAQGREAIVSRGELVEIGGGFRIPDVMHQSGALVREVGTTNRTRAADYAAAISERTALILRVHPSNFRMEGFTERPRLDELVALGQRFNIPVVEDLGSGSLLDDTPPVVDEPRVATSVATGAAVCCFSGDKLLGGPQAGIIVGAKEPLARIRHHPLMRALRAGKMTYAALGATLLEYACGRARTTVPVARMLTTSTEEIAARAEALAGQLAGHAVFGADLVDGVSTVGGGSAPGSALPTRLVRLTPRGDSAASLAARLRGLRPPIVARIEHNCVMLDLRTVLPQQDGQLGTALTTDLTSSDRPRP